MGTTAKIIAISYLVVVLVGITISVALVRSTRVNDGALDTAKLAHREKTWLGIVIALLAVLLLVTIFFIPYGKAAAPDAQVVHVQASQFAWKIDPPTIRAGTQVEFLLTSTDVNHGFGLYNDKDVLLFEVQVVPGKTQKGLYTFTRPGTYRVLCLEFCGFDHHLMQSTITVTPA